MDKTLKATEFRNIFQNSLKINARSMSIKTLMSERNLKRINYRPYYQRNYVWDNSKQTFFIESVILGTEVPPLILFKTGNTIEVIDGRQRFETLKRFKENDLSLTTSGLKELKSLNKQSFNKLSETNQEIFLNSNIRIFEFEVSNHPDISEDIVDRVKKEIFRRYNTGITPLTKQELDNAKYDEDVFSGYFKDALKEDDDLFKKFNECFFPKEMHNLEINKDGIIAKDVDFIRRYRILNSFPISTYAGSDRTEIIDLLYDFANNNADDHETDFKNFEQTLLVVLKIYDELKNVPVLANPLIYGCILWALTIIDKEDASFTYNVSDFIDHYTKCNSQYSEENSFYYRQIINRYSDTAHFFQKLSGCDFSIYIKDEQFKKRVGQLKQTEVDAAKSIEDLSNLRLNKTNPISTPIDEIRTDLQTSRYLIRPSYQRQEKINELKASSIIESILLGINLPPLFIFKRKENIKEVVDGQQRLLSIIAFLGDQFYNENGKLTYSKNNNFKLKGLQILTNLEGSNYSSLPPTMQDRILDFVLDLIIIEQSVNENFDPVDLFIRLNYKPYPIKSNSFEMWNSIVDYEVIIKIKDITALHQSWFFLRERIEGKPDRMENEEMITILSYICYNNQNDGDEVIGLFPRRDRITSRLKDKKGLGNFLVNLDNTAIDKIEFIKAIDRTNHLVENLGKLFDPYPTKDNFNNLLNLKGNKNFRRSLQDFYIIWMVLDKIPDDEITPNRVKILDDIKVLLSMLKNISDSVVDDIYVQNFNKLLLKTTNYYNI